MQKICLDTKSYVTNNSIFSHGLLNESIGYLQIVRKYLVVALTNIRMITHITNCNLLQQLIHIKVQCEGRVAWISQISWNEIQLGNRMCSFLFILPMENTAPDQCYVLCFSLKVKHFFHSLDGVWKISLAEIYNGILLTRSLIAPAKHGLVYITFFTNIW